MYRCSARSWGTPWIALLLDLVVAAVLGATIPLILDRLGQEPRRCLVFLTPVTDASGFFVFLGLATLFLL